MDEETPDPQVTVPIQNSTNSESVSNTIDPRWPYLGKWSAKALPGTFSSAEEKGQASNTIEVTDEETSPLSLNRQSIISAACAEDSTSTRLARTTETVVTEPTPTEAFSSVEPCLERGIATLGESNTSDGIIQQEDAGTNDVTPSEITTAPPTSPFVPSIGAWAKPLLFEPSATPPTPSTPCDFDPKHLNSLLDSFWPTLVEGIDKNQKKKQTPTPIPVREFPLMPVQKIPVPELNADGSLRFPWALNADGSLRFPWAARMDPTTRNLFRAAKPTYRLDGTPEVTIPSQVLRLRPENKREYIIGHFHRCSLPPGGLIHAVVNRLWGRSCRIGCRKLSDSSYMFHIPHDSTCQWVIQRGVWHVDDCLLFVSPWKPVNSFKVPEVSTIPVWVTLKNVPDCCYSRLGLSHVASGLGEPMQTHKPRLDPTCFGEAKLLVEVELHKSFPKKIALDDKQGVETWDTKKKDAFLPAASELAETSITQEDTPAELPQSAIPAEQVVLQTEKSEERLVSAGVEPADKTLEITTETVIEQLQEEIVETEERSTQVNNTTLSKVTIVTDSNSHFTPSPLAVASSAPTHSTIMEDIPSTTTIVSEVKSALVDNSLARSRSLTHGSPFPIQIDQPVEQYDGDGYMSEATANLNMSRGGRPIKPIQKFQDMEWKTVGERGKRDRRGRGNYHPTT